ncbi:MAG: hypothetical protein UY47_C0003G0034 [Parcubacteria group bacterium GW2011_GWB1_49_7]|nr:MAG: hypothetical protein UX28_C0004G0026 [Candidatus Pacebacteria bacterium GW2011_GWA1_46_10]KKW09946.1 MAG: hypothetical protein UY47_C0003G0034 [Parcubacteria group bacterium GW2011_GWB1_49_7]HCR81010.1 hypothetical protein [Candidatus Paceibacterota bacterium]
MIALEQLSSLKDYLKTAETVAVIVGPKPTDDQLAVASALYQGVAALGKEVGLYAPKDLLNRHFTAIKNVSTKLGKQNLVIDFDYNENAVDKVSYHIGEESGKFYLTIKPKKGYQPLDKSTINFSYAGADAELVFLVGVYDLESLNQLYFGYENLYSSAFIVTLHTFKPELGNVQFDLSGTSSMSESVVDILEGLEIPLNADIATDLLAGIESMTHNLQSRTATAETFTVIAKLLQLGARRVNHLEQPRVDQPQLVSPSANKPHSPRQHPVVKKPRPAMPERAYKVGKAGKRAGRSGK